ncbi:MAG: DUF4445 domain-containing protein [Lachnospiraceae bacterium]|nr:DUF4445 domain-containing protein [Lachnospiraceae bacterium]
MNRLTVIHEGKTVFIDYKNSETILGALQKNGFSFRASCGGKGTCNHCLVNADGVLKKACQTLAKDCQTVTILSDSLDTETTIEILSPSSHSLTPESEDSDKHFGIAVDIGTTTIALALVDLHNDSILSSHGFLNPGIAYGADVLNRIDASNNGKLSALKDGLISTLNREICVLLKEKNICPSSLSSICIAANTTMCHLLLGLSCETLGKAPFHPVMRTYPAMSAKELLGDPFSAASNVTVLPGISAFLGGDIVSGLYSLHLEKKKNPFLFVDLGTNGEMILGYQDQFFGTSVAAGPAFEGSRIPGSDVLAAIYEMYQKKVLDQTGLLQGIFFYGGYRYQKYHFSQEDIRQIQLAKASVRAGIETLTDAARIEFTDIPDVYLCGGFGTHTDTEKAISIGMFPEAFRGKMHPMGNTSLAGAVRYLSDPSDHYFNCLQRQTTILDLSSSEIYREAYIRWMDFGS